MTALRNVLSVAASSDRGPSGLARLDALLVDPSTTGHVHVLVSAASTSALSRHAERRVRMAARIVHAVDVAATSEPYRELGARFGITTSDVGEFSQAIAARARGAVLLVTHRARTSWGAAVRLELERLAHEPRNALLLVTLDSSSTSQFGAGSVRLLAGDAAEGDRRIVIDPSSPDDARAFWDALVAADPFFAERGGSSSPFALERLERAVRHLRDDAAIEPEAELRERVDRLGCAARGLVGALLAAREPLQRTELAALGVEPSAIEAAVRAELVRVDGNGRMWLDGVGELSRDLFRVAEPHAERAVQDGLSQLKLDRELELRLAGLLAARPGRDPWAALRAAEIFADSAEFDRAEACAFDALARTSDASARADLWARYSACLSRGSAALAMGSGEPGSADTERHAERWVRAAQRALELGDAERAEALARSALALSAEPRSALALSAEPRSALALSAEPRSVEPGGTAAPTAARFGALVTLARASLARGDVTGAKVVAAHARDAAARQAPSRRGQRAEVEALFSEICFLAGELAEAEVHARAAVAGEAGVATLLAARNMLGKLLLAREAWCDAERQFAEDALMAAQHGHAEDELRARLNRGIAVLSSGRRDEARRAFEEVLAEGERLASLRAVAFALSNLATIAILERRYTEALALSDRAISVRRQLGERLGLVLPVTNLAELRTRLGMLDEAEQALRFGLAACGEGVPRARLARFARAMALVHLERGDTASAARELDGARAGATISGDHALLALCERLAVRIALEDGDVVGARLALEAARACRHTAGGKADVALATALVQRATAEPYLEAALEAAKLAQAADDPELLRECHALLAHAYGVQGELALAAHHQRRAREQRDLVLHALAPALRGRFLARARLGELCDATSPASSHARDDARAAAHFVESPAPPRTRSPSSEPPSSGTARADAPRERDAQRELIGDSAPMRQLRFSCARVALLDAHVLVSGPTGSGKELVAEAIHRQSRRAHGPLVKVNCAALVETLLLSELFGHEKGAFTGASTRRRGRFELADGGTLFLDEIGDISVRTQVALLRVLQDGSFERVGGSASLRADVRVVCATHRDLRAMVDRGEFREDLYYRLSGVVVEVPPLRDRLTDLDALAAELVRRAASLHGVAPKPLAAETSRALARHSWPGNVRELENALRVGCLFAQGDAIETADICDNVASLRHLGAGWHRGAALAPRALPMGAALLVPPTATDAVYAEIRGGTGLADMKKRIEAECISRALGESGGNITRAAQLLGMKRPRLSQLVKEHGFSGLVEDRLAGHSDDRLAGHSEEWLSGLSEGRKV